jgi:hypothetical protein
MNYKRLVFGWLRVFDVSVFVGVILCGASFVVCVSVYCVCLCVCVSEWTWLERGSNIICRQ